LLVLAYIQEGRATHAEKTLLEQLPFQFEQLLTDYLKSLNLEDSFALSKAFDLFNHKMM